MDELREVGESSSYEDRQQQGEADAVSRDSSPATWEEITEVFEDAPDCVVCKKAPVQGIRRCPECDELLTASSSANLVRVFHKHLGEAHPEVAHRY
jgi:hypothetical protein